MICEFSGSIASKLEIKANMPIFMLSGEALMEETVYFGFQTPL